MLTAQHCFHNDVSACRAVHNYRHAPLNFEALFNLVEFMVNGPEARELGSRCFPGSLIVQKSRDWYLGWSLSKYNTVLIS